MRHNYFIISIVLLRIVFTATTVSVPSESIRTMIPSKTSVIRTVWKVKIITNFRKILRICKQFAGNQVNKKGMNDQLMMIRNYAKKTSGIFTS